MFKNPFLNELNFHSLEDLLPTRYCSTHRLNNKGDKLNNIFLYLIKGFLIINFYYLKTLFKYISQSPLVLLKSYKLLIYIPNLKYERFLERIIDKNELKSCLLVSDEKINKQSLGKFSLVKNFGYSLKNVLVPAYLATISLYFKNFKHGNYKNLNFAHLITSIHQSFLLKSLDSITTWEKIFSLHPNGDFHYLLRIMFSSEIHSIRPDTTTFSLEHQFIKTDYLYYKSPLEKEVYTTYGHREKLRPAGYIYDYLKNVKNIKPKARYKILFIDTCTSENLESVQIRRKAIKDFYNAFCDSEKFEVFHKFHPGLVNEEKKVSCGYLRANHFRIIENIEDYSSFDFAVGFYSTLFHEILTNGVLFIELTGIYDTAFGAVNDLAASDFPKLTCKEELNSCAKKIISNPELLYSSASWDWYYKNFNLPDGKYSLKNNLIKN